MDEITTRIRDRITSSTRSKGKDLSKREDVSESVKPAHIIISDSDSDAESAHGEEQTTTPAKKSLKLAPPPDLYTHPRRDEDVCKDGPSHQTYIGQLACSGDCQISRLGVLARTTQGGRPAGSWALRSQFTWKRNRFK